MNEANDTIDEVKIRRHNRSRNFKNFKSDNPDKYKEVEISDSDQ